MVERESLAFFFYPREIVNFNNVFIILNLLYFINIFVLQTFSVIINFRFTKLINKKRFSINFIKKKILKARKNLNGKNSRLFFPFIQTCD